MKSQISLMLEVLGLVVISAAADDLDSFDRVREAPVRKRNQLRHLSSRHAHATEIQVDEGERFDPFMGITRDLRFDSSLSFSNPTYMAPSLSLSSMPPTERKTSFFAIGDVPYSNLEACLLPYELDKAANSGADAKFLLHLGDIRDGKPYESGRPRPCPEYMYQDIATIFESSSVPTFFMVGDNGWLDCADADESYMFWKKHLFTFHERTDLGWPELGATVKHSEDHAEFFAFVIRDVLILGQGLPGRGQDRDHAWNDWDAYLDANVDWTRKAFAENNFKAVVICGNSSKINNERYFEGLEKIAKQYPDYPDVPILFLGDEHDFQEEFEFRGLSNMHRIAFDDVVTPTLITVDPYATGGIENVFKYDRRCPCAGNHRPTELFSYSSGRCAGVCDTNKYCLNEDAESVRWGEDEAQLKSSNATYRMNMVL